MNDKVTWTVISIPQQRGLKKYFLIILVKKPLQRLWNEIIKMVRVDQEDPVAAWDEHNANLEKAHRIFK